jgi:hypothetical protein
MEITGIDFYFNVAFNNEIANILTSFDNNKKLLNSGFEYLKEYDYYLKDEMVIDGDNPKFVMTIIDKEKFFQQILIAKREILLNELNYTIQNSEGRNLKFALTKFLDKLLIIINKVETVKEAPYFNQFNSELKIIIKDIKILISSIIQSHHIFKKIMEVNTALSFFQCKDLSRTFFEKLYEVTYTLDLIDDTIVSEESFIDVLTSNKPSEDSKIEFIKSNPIVAYYLKKIEPFFNNFNAVTIENSGCFYNKQNKLIKASDLYTALSRASAMNQVDFNRIDIQIDKLKTSYLT